MEQARGSCGPFQVFAQQNIQTFLLGDYGIVMIVLVCLVVISFGIIFFRRYQTLFKTFRQTRQVPCDYDLIEHLNGEEIDGRYLRLGTWSESAEHGIWHFSRSGLRSSINGRYISGNTKRAPG